MDEKFIDIHNWLMAFHGTKNNNVNFVTGYIDAMSQERIGKFMELCLKYQMDLMLEIAKNSVRRINITNIDLIQTIVTIEPFNDLFLNVLDNLENLQEDVLNDIPPNFLYKYIIKKFL
jgi:hypothetical protein